MVEFILKQCSLPEDDVNIKKLIDIENRNFKFYQKKSNHPEDATNDQLRASAESILTLFTTTVENMHSILWPALFEYLTNNDYSRSTSILCKSLAYIAEQKRELNSDDYLINYDTLINVPKPFEILARLVVLSGCPMNGKNRGLNVLNLMKNMASNIDNSIVDVWDNVVPKLIANLEGKLKKIFFIFLN